MFTIKFYVFGLVAAILAIFLGGVHPLILYGLYVNTVLAVIFQLSAWPIELSRTPVTPRRRKLLIEALLATIITVVATFLTVDSKSGPAPYFLLMSGIIVSMLMEECAKELNKLLSIKKENNK